MFDKIVSWLLLDAGYIIFFRRILLASHVKIVCPTPILNTKFAIEHIPSFQ